MGILDHYQNTKKNHFVINTYKLYKMKDEKENPHICGNNESVFQHFNLHFQKFAEIMLNKKVVQKDAAMTKEYIKSLLFQLEILKHKIKYKKILAKAEEIIKEESRLQK